MAEEKKAPAAGQPAEKKKKGRISSALKRHQQSIKANVANRSFKATVKTAMRSFEKAVADGNKEAMKKELNAIYSLMDKGVKTNRFKVNTAARTKSRLASKIAI